MDYYHYYYYYSHHLSLQPEETFYFIDVLSGKFARSPVFPFLYAMTGLVVLIGVLVEVRRLYTQRISRSQITSNGKRHLFK